MSDQKTMVKDKKPPQRVWEMVDLYENELLSINNICINEDLVPHYLYASCMTYQTVAFPKKMEMHLTAADYYAENCMLDKAKEIYKGVIVTCNDSATYKHLTRRAEYGLHDLDYKKCPPTLP
jgi:hypothetical protein